jgi:hypothetical protein
MLASSSSGDGRGAADGGVSIAGVRAVTRAGGSSPTTTRNRVWQREHFTLTEVRPAVCVSESLKRAAQLGQVAIVMLRTGWF